MQTRQAKILTVPANGQISIGKSWAGRHILVEEIGNDEIRISSGVFVADSERTFYTKDAKESLDSFNEWEAKKPAKATDVGSLFSSIEKKKQTRVR